MKEALYLYSLIALTIAKPGGYYHQEYNYKSSSSSFKNNELQHKNEDEGFYSKDGDLEGRLKPKVNSHSQHSEYLNPKITGGYQMKNGYGSADGIAYHQANSDRLFNANSNGYQSGAVDGYASSDRVIDLSNVYPHGNYNYGRNQDSYDSSYRRAELNEGSLNRPMGIPSNYGYSQSHNNYGSVQRENTYGASGNNGANTYLNTMAQRLQSDMSRQLENAIYNQFKSSSGYTSSISNTQMSADIRTLEDELRRNLTKQLDESLRSYQNQYTVNTYPATSTKYDYNHQELADVSRQLEDDLMKKLHQDIRTTYSQKSVNSYSSSNNEIYPTVSTTYRPYHERPTVVIPSNIRYTPIPNPESLTQIASKIQSDININLDYALNNMFSTYLSGRTSYYTMEDFNREVDRIKEEISRNLTSNLEDQIRRNYGYQVVKNDYYYSVSGNGDMSSQYNYNVKDYDDLKRQVEANLLKKLNQTVNTYRDEYRKQLSYSTNSNTHSATLRPAYYTSDNKVYDYTDLQRQLSQQVQNALHKHKYESHSSSSSYNPQAYQASLDELSRELQRNLTDQLSSYRAHASSSMSNSYGYGSGSGTSSGNADFESMKSQLQNQLMQQLQQGLQQQHRYSASASYSASSSASGNSNYGSHQSYGNYGGFVECCSPIEETSSYPYSRSKREVFDNAYDSGEYIHHNVKSTRRKYFAKKHSESQLTDETIAPVKFQKTYRRNFQNHHYRNERQTHSDTNQNYQRIESVQNSREVSETNQQVLTDYQRGTNGKSVYRGQKLTQSQENEDDLTQQLETTRSKPRLGHKNSFSELQFSGIEPQGGVVQQEEHITDKQLSQHQQLEKFIPQDHGDLEVPLTLEHNQFGPNDQQTIDDQLEQHFQGQLPGKFEQHESKISPETLYKHQSSHSSDQLSSGEPIQEQQLRELDYEDQDIQSPTHKQPKHTRENELDQQIYNSEIEQKLQEPGVGQAFPEQDNQSNLEISHQQTNAFGQTPIVEDFDQQLEQKNLKDQEILSQNLETEFPTPFKQTNLSQEQQSSLGSEQQLQGQQFEEQDAYSRSENIHKRKKNKLFLENPNQIVENLYGENFALRDPVPSINNSSQVQQEPIDPEQQLQGQQIEDISTHSESENLQKRKKNKLFLEQQNQAVENVDNGKLFLSNEKNDASEHKISQDSNQKFEQQEESYSQQIQQTDVQNISINKQRDDLTQQLESNRGTPLISKHEISIGDPSQQVESNSKWKSSSLENQEQENVDDTQQLELETNPKKYTGFSQENDNQHREVYDQKLQTIREPDDNRPLKISNFEEENRPQALQKDDELEQWNLKPLGTNGQEKSDSIQKLETSIETRPKNTNMLVLKNPTDNYPSQNSVNTITPEQSNIEEIQTQQLETGNGPLNTKHFQQNFGDQTTQQMTGEEQQLVVEHTRSEPIHQKHHSFSELQISHTEEDNNKQVNTDNFTQQKLSESKSELSTLDRKNVIKLQEKTSEEQLHLSTIPTQLQPETQNSEINENASTNKRVLTHTQITHIQQYPTQTLVVEKSPSAITGDLDQGHTSNIESTYEKALRQQNELMNLLKIAVESGHAVQEKTVSSSETNPFPKTRNTYWPAENKAPPTNHYLDHVPVSRNENIRIIKTNTNELSPNFQEKWGHNTLEEYPRKLTLPVSPDINKSQGRIDTFQFTENMNSAPFKYEGYRHDVPSNDLSFSTSYRKPSNIHTGTNGDSQLMGKYTHRVTHYVNGQPIGDIIEKTYGIPYDENLSRNSQTIFSSSHSHNSPSIQDIGTYHYNGNMRKITNRYVNGKLVSSSNSLESFSSPHKGLELENYPSVPGQLIDNNGYDTFHSTHSSYSSKSSGYSGSPSY